MKIWSSLRCGAVATLVLAVSFLGFPIAHAAVPKLLTYQGVLKDGSGNFLTGTYSMTFRLYSASTGGSALWTETQSSVSASSGKFSVQLGSVTAIALDFNADYWLSIQVGADSEMTPRVRLTSAGYGIRSDYETNGFTQAQHDGLTHKGVEGVKDNSVNIGKTNFKLDSYTLAVANSMGDMIIDTFADVSGINAGASSNYTWRGSPYYDVIVSPGGIDSNAKLVLHANGTDASTTFTDSSSGAKTVTANGNAQIDTAQSKFGGASCLLDGTGDYLSIPDHADWDFGTGDFTWEFWLRFNNVPSIAALLDRAANTKWAIIYYNAAGGFRVYLQGSSYDFAWTPSASVWYHVAVTRSGSNLRVFVNGAQVGTTQSNSTDLTGTTGIAVGANTDGSSPLDGWIDEVRISNTARWTANFTPLTTEYSTTGGTATVISNAYSEPAVPAEVLVTADETLNTGSITYYVSRDNGTTWTQCTKETATSISSQPSGTQLKWKASITGDAELNAIAVSV